ncbi:S8 family serine peptidase [Sulfurimonas aquatica]|uniref:S8 family serine peptidase n=1 Tax=Sulfurimonas aquatica TaxID=2672570 RepID=A0A975GC48_9BACT|nr:S8 family serine peptidase [Sulfurimonas aquatica]QSZ40913.1 S8 family serine peptidase [Sulfurimonas aquatica]
MKSYIFFLIVIFFLFGCGSSRSAQSNEPLDDNTTQNESLENNAEIDDNTTQIDANQTQNDPLMTYQWYLYNEAQNVGDAKGGSYGEDINLKSVWDSYTGKGVKISIVDTGIDSSHKDLQNVDQNLSFRYSDEINTSDLTSSQTNNSLANAHGTACAGIIGAQKNSYGIRGVAYGATLIGLNVYSNPTDETFLRALSYEGVDISSNSWGNSGNSLFDDTYTVSGIESGLEKGREGKGTIYVFAASNLATNSNTFTPASHRGAITVAATDADAKQASYSNYGSNILLCAPGGEDGYKEVAIVTTDLTGKNFGMDEGIIDKLEENNGDYTAVMNGTSAATPMVSGAVALMLEANPTLTWRDIKYILARSARVNDASNDSWHLNGAGYSVSEKYGFGMLDVNASVEMALDFKKLGNASETTLSRNSITQAIPDNNTKGIVSSVTILEDILVEHVDAWVDITHACIGQLKIKLTSPSSTVVNLAYADGISGKYEQWRFGAAHFLDENSNGEWKLEVIDPNGGCNGALNEFSLKIYGRKL